MATTQPDKATGITPFLDANTAYDAYLQTKIWLTPYFLPIDEFERVARNRPKDGIPDYLPKLTEGTTAALSQESPKRIIQQIATGSITSDGDPGLALVADYVHKNKLIPQYEYMGTKMQKDWNMLGKAMIWGRSASYTYFTKTKGQFHTDYSIPYVKDILTEKGKVYGPDSNYIFMRAWYSKADLKAIIAHQDEGWDYKLLAQMIDADVMSTKPAELQTPAERERQAQSGGHEIIHVFQKGIGATFYSFSPHFKQGVVLRTKINKDPRGAIPIDFEYCNLDLSNPLGRGMVELAAPLQNLLDQKLQMHSYMSTILMAPPLQVFGNVNKASIKYRPNAIWDMGTSPTNIVKPLDINNAAIQAFVPEMQFLQSRIQAIFATQDNSIPAASNTAGQSKTTAGVKAATSHMGVADNYFEKQHESWFQAQAETSVNTYFAEMKTTETVELGEEDINRLMGTPAEKYIDEKTQKLKINYGDINKVSFAFQTDPGSSTVDDDQDQLQRLQAMLQEVSANGLVINYYLSQSGVKMNLGELYKQQFERMGIKNLDLILEKMNPDEAQQAKQQPFPIIDKPQIRINSADLSPSALTAALAAGGVQIPQLQPGQPPADPLTSASAQAQLDFHTEMAKVQSAQSQNQAPTAPQGPSDTELQLKQEELEIKKQIADQGDVRLHLEAEKTAHTQGLAETQQAHSQAMDAMKHAQSVQAAEEAAKFQAEQQGQINTTQTATSTTGRK